MNVTRNIVGPPVIGDDCFGREAFVQEFEQRLETSSVLLLAPRRWGKTSVLRVLRDRDSANRHYFDLYHLENASDFVAEVAATLAGPVARVRQKIGEILDRTLGRVNDIRIGELALELRDHLAGEPSWQDTAASVFGSVPAGHVLIFDEFPVLAKTILDTSPTDAAALLRVLRHQRQRDQPPRMVFAGSTSLPEVCRRAALSDTINDLDLLPLPRFDRQIASELLRRLFASEAVPLDARSLNAILEIVGPEVPFFLQVLTRALLSEVRDTDAAVTPALVKRVYQDVLLGPDYRAYLDDFHGRLDRSYLPGERDVATTVLSALSRRREGLEQRALRDELVDHQRDEDLLDRVLLLLEGDFYVSRDGEGRYRFANRYLADWWQRFHA